jgi:predicted DNA-binding transcriptional regulator AlpA
MDMEMQGLDGMPFGPKKLLTVRELSSQFGLSKSFVYQHTMEGAKHPLPVVRIGERSVRFDPDKIFHLYSQSRAA